MFKKGVLILITFYQLVISGILKQVLGVSAMCRYSPSCSEYMRQSVQKYGIIKGSLMGLKRLATCHPFGKGKQ